MFKYVLIVIGVGLALFLYQYRIDVPTDSTINEQSTSKNLEQTDRSNTPVVSNVTLPIRGSAPEQNTKHIIPIEEIKRGCFRQDCIPSIDNPEFLTALEMQKTLDPRSIGIALSYKGEQRFYPFPMLETHELVNDVVAGDPLLISYCPLCGTGIVFERVLDGEVVEFGVSGMLWQSNLLMYNRAEELENRNLWSQVLGMAVVGDRAGETLNIIPSDIMRFEDWVKSNPTELVLYTGAPQDPYSGEYYKVATNFNPNFDPSAASIEPDTYVYGLMVGEQPVAVVKSILKPGNLEFVVDEETIFVAVSDTVTFTDKEGELFPDIEGFWFSWQAAHPDTMIVSNI